MWPWGEKVQWDLYCCVVACMRALGNKKKKMGEEKLDGRWRSEKEGWGMFSLTAALLFGTTLLPQIPDNRQSSSTICPFIHFSGTLHPAPRFFLLIYNLSLRLHPLPDRGWTCHPSICFMSICLGGGKRQCKRGDDGLMSCLQKKCLLLYIFWGSGSYMLNVFLISFGWCRDLLNFSNLKIWFYHLKYRWKGAPEHTDLTFPTFFPLSEKPFSPFVLKRIWSNLLSHTLHGGLWMTAEVMDGGLGLFQRVTVQSDCSGLYKSQVVLSWDSEERWFTRSSQRSPEDGGCFGSADSSTCEFQGQSPDWAKTRTCIWIDCSHRLALEPVGRKVSKLGSPGVFPQPQRLHNQHTDVTHSFVCSRRARYPPHQASLKG